jgi:hypothetical protein
LPPWRLVESPQAGKLGLQRALLAAQGLELTDGGRSGL